MESLEKLKKIGAEEISRRTHIAPHKIEYILESRFESLEPISTIGFLGILEREFKVDLSEWRQQFKEYVKDNPPPTALGEKDDVNVRLLYEGKSKRSIKYQLITFLVLIVVGIFAYFAYSYFADFSQDTEVKHEVPIVGYSTNSEVEQNKTQEALELINKDLQSSSQDYSSSVLKNTASSEENLSLNTNEANTSTPSNSTKIVSDKNTTAPQSTQTSTQNLGGKLVFIPRSEMWVGVVFLDNGEKKNYLSTGRIEVPLNRESILTTGHGDAEVFINGVKQDIQTADKLRYHIVNGVPNLITLQEFKRLNGGVGWQ